MRASSKTRLATVAGACVIALGGAATLIATASDGASDAPAAKADGTAAKADGTAAKARVQGRRCPRGDRQGFRARRLVGKRTRRARRIARRHDCTVRVVKRRSEWLAVTDDFALNRINVAVRSRRVTAVKGVF